MTPVEGDPARGGGAPLDSSSHSWMPFLGSFAPAGYEPAAAPDPLAWSMNWPIGMGYSPYMSAMAIGGGGGGGGGGSLVGPPPSHYLPVIGTTASAGETPAAVEGAGSSARPSAAEGDELDLDALAQLEQVQSDLLLQSHAVADADLVRTSTSQEEEERFPAATASAAAPNGSSPPFDLFALLRSPSPVHPFAAATGNVTASVPFAFDPWGPAAITSPIKLHPSNSVPQQQQQQLSTSSVTSVERGRQLQVGVKSELLPATVGHAANFLASSDWAFTQAYLLSHCELFFSPFFCRRELSLTAHPRPLQIPRLSPALFRSRLRRPRATRPHPAAAARIVRAVAAAAVLQSNDTTFLPALPARTLTLDLVAIPPRRDRPAPRPTCSSRSSRSRIVTRTCCTRFFPGRLRTWQRLPRAATAAAAEEEEEEVPVRLRRGRARVREGTALWRLCRISLGTWLMRRSRLRCLRWKRMPRGELTTPAARPSIATETDPRERRKLPPGIGRSSSLRG
jgi:hypothetical protein